MRPVFVQNQNASREIKILGFRIIDLMGFLAGFFVSFGLSFSTECFFFLIPSMGHLVFLVLLKRNKPRGYAGDWILYKFFSANWKNIFSEKNPYLK